MFSNTINTQLQGNTAAASVAAPAAAAIAH
jgi:hypothetical protein